MALRHHPPPSLRQTDSAARVTTMCFAKRCCSAFGFIQGSEKKEHPRVGIHPSVCQQLVATHRIAFPSRCCCCWLLRRQTAANGTRVLRIRALHTRHTYTQCTYIRTYGAYIHTYIHGVCMYCMYVCTVLRLLLARLLHLDKKTPTAQQKTDHSINWEPSKLEGNFLYNCFDSFYSMYKMSIV